MHPAVIALIAALLALVGLTVHGVLKKERSLMIGFLDVFLCLFSAYCALYAWFESQSMPWAIGYGVAAIVFLLFGIITFFKPK